MGTPACLDLPVRMIEAPTYEGAARPRPMGTINAAWFQYLMHPRYNPRLAPLQAGPWT